MTVRTDAELLFDALVIRNETIESANTALRVGQMLVDIIDSKPNYDIYTIPDSPGDNYNVAYALGGQVFFSDDLRVTPTAIIVGGLPIQGVSNPSNSQDVATKAYVDAIAVGLQIKDEVRVSSTGNLTLNGEQTIDGVAVVDGDRVLVRHQTAPEENGIYVVVAGDDWIRSTDADTWDELISAFVFVEFGTLGGKTGWVAQLDVAGALGVDPITWAKFSAANNYTAGAGLALTGTVFSLDEIPSNTILANATGGDAVPSAFAFGANTFLGRSVSGAISAKAMIEQVFGLAALTFGAANTLPKVNTGGSAFEYGKITTANIDPSAAITLAQLEQIAGLSVVANATNALAVPTAVVAASDFQVFRRSGTSLAFGAINLASTNAVSGLLAFTNIADGSALSVLGRSVNSAGAMASIAGTEGQVLRVASSVLGFGTIAAAGIADGSITLAKLANGVTDGEWLYWDGAAWARTTTALTDGAKLSLGTGATLSGAGLINVPHAFDVLVGLTGAASQSNLISWGLSTDRLDFGSFNLVAGMNFDVKTAGTYTWNVAGAAEMVLSATTLDGNQNSLTDWSFASFGTTPAGSGAIRLSTNQGINIFLNGANTVNLIGETTTNHIVVGGNDAAVTFIDFSMGTGGVVAVKVAGVTEYSFSSTTLDGNQNSLTDWSFIALGADPAASGAVRLTNLEAITSKSASGTVNLIGANTTAVIIGGDSVITEAQIRVPNGITIGLVFAGAYEYVFSQTTLDGNQNSLTDWSFIALGTSPATTGDIRLPNDFRINFLSQSGSANIQVLWSVDDVLIFGGDTTTVNTQIRIPSGTFLDFNIAGVLEYTFGAAAFAGQQNALTNWSFIELGDTGANVASSGLIRTNNNVSFWRARTSGGSTVEILNFGSGATNTLFVGATTGVTGIRQDVATAGSFTWYVNNVIQMTLDVSTLDGAGNTLTNWASLALSSFIAFGADPADTGAVRLSNGSAEGIYFEASPAGTDVGIFLDASEVLQVYNSEYGFSTTTLDGNQNSLTDWSFIELGGGTIATAGLIRVANNQTILRSKTAGGTDVNLLVYDSANQLLIGDNTNGSHVIAQMASGASFHISIAGNGEYHFSATEIDLEGNGLHRVGYYNVSTGGVHDFRINAVTEYTLSATTFDGNQNSLTDWSFIELGGGTVAGTGMVRTASNRTIIGTKTSGGSDFKLLEWDGSNNIFIGDKDTSGAANIALNITTGGAYFFRINTVDEYSWTASTMDFNQNTITDCGSIQLGSGTTASGALINVSTGVIMRARLTEVAANMDVLSLNSSDELLFGGGGGSADYPDAIISFVGASGAYEWRFNNVVEYTLLDSLFDGNQNGLSDWAYAGLGSGTVSTTGLIRVANNQVIISAKDTGGSNTNILYFDSNDDLQIGDATNVDLLRYQVASGGSHNFMFAGNSEASISIGGLNGNGSMAISGFASAVFTSFVTVGSGTVASSGYIRVPVGFNISGYTGSTTAQLFGWSGTTITIGQSLVDNMTFSLKTGGVFTYQINDVTKFTFDANKIFIADTGAAPSAPAGGYHIYSSGGALMGRGSNGTITTIGTDDPHCPRCKSDFIREWRNPKYAGTKGISKKGHFAVCLVCMADSMERHGIPFEEFVVREAA